MVDACKGVVFYLLIQHLGFFTSSFAEHCPHISKSFLYLLIMFINGMYIIFEYV